jgi:hypothetical protein
MFDECADPGATILTQTRQVVQPIPERLAVDEAASEERIAEFDVLGAKRGCL